MALVAHLCDNPCGRCQLVEHTRLMDSGSQWFLNIYVLPGAHRRSGDDGMGVVRSSN